MKYRVINKDGDFVDITYICFGTLSMVDAWFSEFQGNLDFTIDGVNRPDWADDNSLVEEINGCKYIRGFYPANFKTLRYEPNMDRAGIGFFLKHPEVLDHPLFKDVVMSQDEANVYFSIDMEDKGMDETLYPLLFIRNACEYVFSINSIEKALEEGASPTEALFIGNLIGVSNGLHGNGYYTMEGGDSCIMYSLNAPFGNFMQLIRGDLPFVYYDRKWSETDQGYSAYGRYAEKFVSWDDMIVPEWDDDDEEVEDEVFEEKPQGFDPEIQLPIHPVTGTSATLVCASAFEKPDVYKDELAKTLMSIRPTNDEEFKEFVQKVKNHV
ncbi:MAG: hypothetical protein ACRDC4_05075 [Plesiomonas sp.]